VGKAGRREGRKWGRQEVGKGRERENERESGVIA
jgi:hypothetical protein